MQQYEPFFGGATAFVTRAEYDSLIGTAWMTTWWLKLERRWNINGCWVYGPANAIEQLAAMCQ